MSNAIKYSTGTETEALKIGNYWVGTGDVGKGPTTTTDYWASISPPSGGFTLYGHKPNISSSVGGPSIYVCSDSSELLSLTNRINGTNFTQLADCLQWYTTQTDRMVFNFDYESITSNGLIINLDAKFYPSYPISGLTWSNIGTTTSSPNAILQGSPSPTIDESGLSIVFSDSNSNYANMTTPGNLSTWTCEVWFYLTKALTGKVTSIICGAYDATSKLNFTIGTNNAPTNTNLAVGFFDGSWHSTTGFIPDINTWYQVVGTYDGTTLRQYVDGVANGGTLAYTGTPQSGGEIRLMRRWDSPISSSNLVDGKLAIARVYNRALSDSEILTNYNAQSSRFVTYNVDTTNLTMMLEPQNYTGGSAWVDVTDNGYIAGLNGGVTYSSSFGGYFDFDGVDDTMSISDNTNLQLSTTQARSFQVWFNIDTLPASGFMPIFGKLSSSYGFDGHYAAIQSDGKIRFVTNGGSIAKINTTTATYTTGTWYFLTCISQITSTSNSTKIYINSTEVLSDAHGTDTYSENNDFYLGYIGSGVSSQYLDGKIGAVYVYSNALTASQVLNNFNATKTRFGL